MLFNFFRKHEQQSAVREHLGGFQDSFSDIQKKAVLFSLFLIANCDGDYHIREEQFLEQTSTFLGTFLSDKLIDEFFSMDRDQVLRLLNSLSETQKDWYIITIAGMVHADGRALEKEFQLMEVFLEEMGITESRFIGVLEKADLLARKFL